MPRFPPLLAPLLLEIMSFTQPVSFREFLANLGGTTYEKSVVMGFAVRLLRLIPLQFDLKLRWLTSEKLSLQNVSSMYLLYNQSYTKRNSNRVRIGPFQMKATKDTGGRVRNSKKGTYTPEYACATCLGIRPVVCSRVYASDSLIRAIIEPGRKNNENELRNLECGNAVKPAREHDEHNNHNRKSGVRRA